MPPPLYPEEVRRLPDERVLRITWSDQHVSEYPWAYLRGWCPCAGCQGHGNEKRFVHAQDTDLARIGLVGRYALNPVWGDGHETGIYSYTYLRELCPCCGERRDP
ncbi:MAG: gamma-butyrobetaine hydroxylase-like domain-containing protein [Candidatus Binatia bacterium]